MFYFFLVVYLFQHCHVREYIPLPTTGTPNSEQFGSDEIKIIILAFYNYISKGLYLQTPICAFPSTVLYSFSSFFLDFHASSVMISRPYSGSRKRILYKDLHKKTQ